MFGSVASQQDTAQSDIDVLVVSASLGYGEPFGALEPATAALGRTVNPTLYTLDDLAQRRAQGNAFVTRVLNQPKLWLIGTTRRSMADPRGNLCGPGKALRAEAPDTAELAGLIRSGLGRLNDAGTQACRSKAALMQASR